MAGLLTDDDALRETLVNENAEQLMFKFVMCDEFDDAVPQWEQHNWDRFTAWCIDTLYGATFQVADPDHLLIRWAFIEEGGRMGQTFTSPLGCRTFHKKYPTILPQTVVVESNYIESSHMKKSSVPSLSIQKETVPSIGDAVGGTTATLVDCTKMPALPSKLVAPLNSGVEGKMVYGVNNKMLVERMLTDLAGNMDNFDGGTHPRILDANHGDGYVNSCVVVPLSPSCSF
jgi:hypothetical protein